MRWFRYAVFILIAAVLQDGLIGLIAINGIRPDLLLILVVFFAIYCDTTDAIITSFTIGFIADLIPPSTMGPQIISFGLCGTAFAYLNRVISIRKMSYQFVAIFAISILAGILAYFLTALRSSPGPNFLSILFKTSIYSAILGPFLFLPSAWLMRIKTYRFRRRR